MEGVEINKLEETCAHLEDVLDALMEAQPKTVKERASKIIASRTDSKLEQCPAKHKKEQQSANTLAFGLFGLFIVIFLGLLIRRVPRILP